MKEPVAELKQTLKILNLTEAAQIIDQSLMEAEQAQ